MQIFGMDTTHDFSLNVTPLSTENIVEATENILFQELQLSPSTQFAVAFSGGCDSLVLLHVMWTLQARHGFHMTALHFDHGIHPESDSWRQQCQLECERLDVEFMSVRKPILPSRGENLEAVARKARYHWFAEAVSSEAVVLTGHHLDDQVETMLLSLFRGKGLHGLTGMRIDRPILHNSRIRLIRPFIRLERKQVRDFAELNRLVWIEDPSNTGMDFDRNYLRHEILPNIHSRWNGVSQAMERTRSRLSRLLSVQDQAIQEKYDEIVRPKDRRLLCLGEPLDAKSLGALSVLEFESVIRLWFHSSGLVAASDRLLHGVYQQLNDDTPNAGGFRLGGHSVRRFSDRLYLVENTHFDPPETPVTMSEADLILTDLGIRLSWFDDQGNRLNHLEERVRDIEGKARLVWRQGGERVVLKGRKHGSSLKKLLQAQKIPPWERDCLPMLMINDEIVWVSGLGWLSSANSEHQIHHIFPRFESLCD